MPVIDRFVFFSGTKPIRPPLIKDTTIPTERTIIMKQWKRLSHLLVLLFLIGTLCLGTLCSCDSAPADTPGTDAVTETDDGKSAITYSIGRGGGGRIEGWMSQHGLPGETAAQEVTAVPKFGYRFAGWSDGMTEPTRHDVFGEEDKHITANFTFDRKNLPIISLG